MKNFVLAQAPLTSESAFVLLHLDPSIPDELREFEPFAHFSRWMVQRGYAANTIRVYSEHVARFIDYVYEASKIEFPSNLEINVSSIIYSYQSFLLHGQQATNPIAKTLAESLGKITPTSPTSLSQNIEASIRWFLQASAERPKSSPDKLFSPFYTKLPQYRTYFQKSAQKANSFLASVIQGALESVLPKRRGATVFPLAKRADRKIGKSSFKGKAYPIEKCVDLVRQKRPIHSKTFYRDMCIYSLLAASGARSCEVLQLRFCDVDPDGNLAVFLRNPFDRTNPGLSESEFEKLAWKGRETEITFLIEPFATIFQENFEKYLAFEYNSCVNHEFIFQDINGRPYFACDRSNRIKSFKKYAQKSGLAEISEISPHSLRHMYGVYVLNYMPIPGNKTSGLPLAYVRLLMGHANIESTMKYAKHDTEIIEAYIQHANQYVSQRGEKSLITIREEYHLRQLEIVRNEASRLGWGS
jgi:site-specific recombinase XerD